MHQVLLLKVCVINNKTLLVNQRTKCFIKGPNASLLLFLCFSNTAIKQSWRLNPFQKPYLYLENIWLQHKGICSRKIFPIVLVASECCSRWIQVYDLNPFQIIRKIYLLKRFIQGWINKSRRKFSIFINDFSSKIAILTRFR